MSDVRRTQKEVEKGPRFRIYYDDGSAYVGEPADAPGLGVVVIVQPDEDVGRMVMSRWDYFCLHDDGQWWVHDLTGLMDCLALPGFNRVLIGRTVSQDDWQAINAAALADPDFQPKSAERVLERPRGLR